MCVGKYETCKCCGIQKTTWYRCPGSWKAVAEALATGGEEIDYPHPSTCIVAYNEFGYIPVGLCPNFNNDRRPCSSWLLAVLNRHVSADDAEVWTLRQQYRQQREKSMRVASLREFERSGVFQKRPLEETAKPIISNLTNQLIMEAWGRQYDYEEQLEKRQIKMQLQQQDRRKAKRDKNQEMKVIRSHIMRSLQRPNNFRMVGTSLGNQSYRTSKESQRRGVRIFNSLVTSTGLEGG